MSAPYDLASALEGFLVQEAHEQPARLLVGPTELTVRVDATGAEHHLPWRGARLQRRQLDGALLVSTKAGTAGSLAPEFLRAIESAVGNDLGAELAKLEGPSSKSRNSGWLGCAAFFAIVALLIWSIPGCIRKGVDTAVEAAPFSLDETLGEAAEGAMEAGPLVTDERVVAPIQAMVQRLARGVERVGGKPPVEWTVRVVRDSTVNAFALPGGYITVFTGLIAAADTPEMVAGVLAHEMAHVTERHGLRRIGQSLGFFAAIQLLLGDVSGIGGIAKEMLTIASVNAYSREQETEADLVGVRFLHAAEVDPRALGQFFELLQASDEGVPEALSWMSTHPQHRERIDAIASEAEHLGLVTWVPLEVDWKSVKGALGD
ncbi:MAG: M48 family metallopeptidase [Planctomycetota bacterium]